MALVERLAQNFGGDLSMHLDGRKPATTDNEGGRRIAK